MWLYAYRKTHYRVVYDDYCPVSMRVFGVIDSIVCNLSEYALIDQIQMLKESVFQNALYKTYFLDALNNVHNIRSFTQNTLSW